ncbi:hypothetical protein MMC07_000150 [Pseudocyphellaria aurata]|nr:hypothetical protein [Pseudocyphellaria aurata]
MFFGSHSQGVTESSSATFLAQCSPDVENPLPSASVDTASAVTRKRKYAAISKHVDVCRPFVIQAHSSSASMKLAPQLLIPRSCLPLAFLDPGRDLQGNRLFCAHIPVLEEDGPSDLQSMLPTILIAASEDNACLYAVERVRRGTYALCRLGAWVTLKKLERLKLECSSQQRTTSNQRASLPGDEWWHASAIKADSNHERGQSQKQNQVNLGELRLCLKAPRPATIAQAVEEVSAKEDLCETQNEATVERGDTLNEPPPKPLTQDPDETLRMIRSQYQEALYISQGSLAYFAKGPLSRARALFNCSDVLSTDGMSLADYLRTCILSLPTMDKKYRETLPSLVKELPVGVLSEDENGVISTSFRKKPRKTKTLKVGKDGLYPEEELCIVKWWLGTSGRIDSENVLGNREEWVRMKLLEQRARETQLQIILVLEILALEASKPEKSGEDVSAVVKEKNFPSKQKPKSKKAQDLSVLLDLLVDRLCIWQSMSTEESSSSTKEGKSGSQINRRMPNHIPEVDVLRNFCVDVILPFYSARLPDKSTVLCLKLGGPKPVSPARPMLRKAATSSQGIPNPGTAIHRQQMRRPRRTLERVLTEERLASRNPPSLSRSATDSALPRLKREVSEASMSSIPTSNVSISNSRRYSQREVDLSSISQAMEAKLKKKDSVEQELKGAIAALKKPNPRMAVKELVDAADRRAGLPNWRKAQNPLCNLSAQGVQVMATPRVKKKRDAFGDPSSLPYSHVAQVPPSSTAHKVISTPRIHNGPGACHPNVQPTIEQTPCRGSSKLVKFYPNLSSSLKRQNELGPAPVAVLNAKHSGKMTTTSISDAPNLETPLKADSWTHGQGSSSQEIPATPVKGLTTAQVTALRASKSSLPGKENEECIYESLGWNDPDELM